MIAPQVTSTEEALNDGMDGASDEDGFIVLDCHTSPTHPP